MDKLVIKEVSPRDGLQIVKPVSLDVKEQFIRKLIDANIKHIEIGSFVNAKKVPQMAKTKELIIRLQDELDKCHLFCLVFTSSKMKEVIESKLSEVSIIIAASETFNQKNIQCTTKEAIKRASEIITISKSNNIKVRAYVAMAFGCPYEGDIPLKKVMNLAEFYLQQGVDELIFADTIGYAIPTKIKETLVEAKKICRDHIIGMHLHDTKKMAKANTLESIKQGVRIFDSSVGGLGGCPFAKGAKGNISTEDMLQIASELGFSTGIDREKLNLARNYIFDQLKV